MEMTEEEFEKSNKNFIKDKKKEVYRKFIESGADLVINSIADLPEAIEMINQQLNSSQYPGKKINIPSQPYELFTPGP